MTYQIEIQGSLAVASKQIERRAIPRILSGRTNRDHTVLVVEASPCTLEQWAAEPPYKGPFPDGALLFYGPCRFSKIPSNSNGK